jgi:hypothetical protein
VTLTQYANSGATEEEAKIQAASVRLIGSTKEEVIDAVFGKKLLSRKTADEVYELAETHPEDGDPRSFWGFAQGVTRYSQGMQYADARTQLDTVAGKVLELAF